VFVLVVPVVAYLVIVAVLILAGMIYARFHGD
jgi:hypothetical protein